MKFHSPRLVCLAAALATAPLFAVAAAEAQESPTCGGRTATIVGTEGPDELDGTDGADVIVGLGGADIINGFDGNDLICAGRGADIVDGGPGRDRIWGNAGADELSGSGGRDRLFGQGGDDVLHGGGGNDRLRGGGADDTLIGGRGNDALDGADGNDSVRGGPGVDRFAGAETCTNVDAAEVCESEVQPVFAEALALLAELDVVDWPDRDDYERDDYDGWQDADGDCLNTRDEVLLRDSDPATEQQACDVRSGSWLDPYDRTSQFSDAADVSIDHVVPLAHAHRAGAWEWDTATKKAFGNDLDLDATLAATGTQTNGSKGMKGPDEWLPPADAAHCTYAVDWVAIKWRWSLDVRPAEQAELNQILATCIDDGASIELPVPWPPPKAQLSFDEVPEPVDPTPPPDPVDPPPTPGASLELVRCDRDDEFVEVRNAGTTTADLSGWQIDDESTVAHLFDFPAGFTLAPGESVLVVSGPDAIEGPGRLLFKRNHVWNNDGDTAFLLDPAGTLVDELRCT